MRREQTKETFLKISAFSTYHQDGYEEAVSIYPEFKEFLDQNKDKDFKQVEAEVMGELERLLEKLNAQ